jgi:L-seryl-tRNA(Ser) seleniumtransferase
LDKYINEDHDKEWKMWEDNIGYINDAVKKVKGVTTEIKVPPIANHTPKLTITWDKNIVHLDQKQLGEKLRNGDPSIEVISWGEPDNNISLTVFMLKKGEHKIVAKRIQQELLQASA